MKKIAVLCLFTLLLGCGIGLLFNLTALSGHGLLFLSASAMPLSPLEVGLSPQATAAPSSESLDSNDTALLLDAGSAVLAALEEKDISALSALVDEQQGVTFTPFSTVAPNSNLTFLPEQLVKAEESTTRYIWGIAQGTGDPIEATLLW